MYTHASNIPMVIRDNLAEVLDEVCQDVEIKPLPQPLQGENFDKSVTAEDEHHLDTKANCLRGTVLYDTRCSLM